MKLLFRLLQAVVLMAVVGSGYLYWRFAPPKPPQLQAFINANVLTINASNDRAEAVLLEGDTIIAVGSTQHVTSLVQSHPARKHVQVSDLAGKTLMPGFIDAHSHFPGSGVYELAADLNAPPIGSIKSIEQMQAVLRQLDKQRETGWLFGMGYDDTQMLESRHPMRQELDAISTSRPIFILHISGHMGVANTAALTALGITENSTAPAGGDYVKNERDQLTGLLLETAVLPFLQQATNFSVAEIMQVVSAAANDYAEHGITTAQNGAADNRHIQGLYWASKLGAVAQRLIVWPTHDALPEQELAELRANNTSKFEVGAIKLIADGSIQGYTAYLTEPYYVAPETYHALEQEDGFRGKPVIKREKLLELVKYYFKQGQQLAIHGNGDAAIDDTIYAVEQALIEFPRVDPRTVLIHAQMARKDQLKKMLELGITPSFFSVHTYYWGDRHRSIFLGNKRARNISPARSAQRLGLPFSIHLDTPVVPMQPMRLLWSAVNRKSSAGRVIGRHERISREQALRAITIDAAYQVFKDKLLGSIEVGKLADLVVLDKDPSDKSQSLLEIKVHRTYVGGVEIYANPRRDKTDH